MGDAIGSILYRYGRPGLWTRERAPALLSSGGGPPRQQSVGIAPGQSQPLPPIGSATQARLPGPSGEDFVGEDSVTPSRFAHSNVEQTCYQVPLHMPLNRDEGAYLTKQTTGHIMNPFSSCC